MKTIEEKKTKWEELKPEIVKEIGNKYEITVEGLDNTTEYLHPIVKINEFEYLRAQGDFHNIGYYAVYLHTTREVGKYPEIEINLKTNSFSKGLSIFKKKKLSMSIEETFKEIEAIKENIEYMRALIDAKKLLLNSIVKRN